MVQVTATIKALWVSNYGKPDNLSIKTEAPQPVGESDIRIKVLARQQANMYTHS